MMTVEAGKEREADRRMRGGGRMGAGGKARRGERRGTEGGRRRQRGGVSVRRRWAEADECIACGACLAALLVRPALRLVEGHVGGLVRDRRLGSGEHVRLGRKNVSARLLVALHRPPVL